MNLFTVSNLLEQFKFWIHDVRWKDGQPIDVLFKEECFHSPHVEAFILLGERLFKGYGIHYGFNVS